MSKIGRKKFSIITVCYNAEQYIARTIQSILNQSYSEFEYVIKDGRSTDNTVKIIYQLIKDDPRVKLIVNRDNGIYDAMNIAVKETSGEYVIFLNAGDVFENTHVLQRTDSIINARYADIYYGDIVEVTLKNRHIRHYSKKNSQLWYYCLGACLCHQSMFCTRELFEEKQFDTSYSVCADKDWQMFFLKKRCKAINMNIIISEVLVDGFSSNHIEELEKDTRNCIKKYNPELFPIYIFIQQIKKIRFVQVLLTYLEKRMSCVAISNERRI